jgi:hypothetical protein
VEATLRARGLQGMARRRPGEGSAFSPGGRRHLLRFLQRRNEASRGPSAFQDRLSKSIEEALHLFARADFTECPARPVPTFGWDGH